jgi:hypothetical protein
LHKQIPHGNISLLYRSNPRQCRPADDDVGDLLSKKRARFALGSQVISGHSEYKKFRREIINGTLSEERSTSYGYPGSHRTTTLREQINRFRSHLVWGWPELLESDPDAERHLKKALRIPADMNLCSSGQDIFFKVLLEFLPLRVALKTVRTRLSAIGTYEGRELLFLSQFKRTLPAQGLYTKSFDYALRNLVLPQTCDTFRDMRDIDINWMKACVKLGARRYEDVSKVYYRDDGHANEGALIFALVRSNVVTSLDQLMRIPTADRFYSRHDLENENIRKFQQVVELLKFRGMDPASIMTLVNVPLHRFCPERLTNALCVFNFSGADLTFLFQQGGASVIFAEADRWLYLRDVLGVRTVREALSLRRLLVSDERQCAAFVQAMRQGGADIDALSTCQSILLSVAEKSTSEARAISALNILVSPLYVRLLAGLTRSD